MPTILVVLKLCDSTLSIRPSTKQRLCGAALFVQSLSPVHEDAPPPYNVISHQPANAACTCSVVNRLTHKMPTCPVRSGCQASVQTLIIEIAWKLGDGHRHRPGASILCRGKMQPCRLGRQTGSSRQGWLMVGDGLGGEKRGVFTVWARELLTSCVMRGPLSFWHAASHFALLVFRSSSLRSARC